MSDRGWGDEHPKILNVSTMKNNGGCGFTEADIEETIKWWANKASPVTNAPSHPDRHDATEKAKASNRFNVLAESERKEHSLLTGSFPKFVYTVLTSKVGKAAWKYLFEAREPRRVTFSVPQTAKKFGLKGFYFQRGEIVGEDKDAGGALLIVDVDGQG